MMCEIEKPTTTMEVEKEDSIVKDVARAGVTGALVASVIGGSPLVSGTAAMSMAATSQILQKIRGKDDVWNAAVAGGVAFLSVGMFYRESRNPRVCVPFVIAGSIAGAAAHVLYYDD